MTRTLYRYATTTALEGSLSYAIMFALVKSTDSVLILFWNILQETGRCLFSTDSVLKHSLRNWKVLIQCWLCSETFFKKPEGTESMLILFWSIRLLTLWNHRGTDSMLILFWSIRLLTLWNHRGADSMLILFWIKFCSVPPIMKSYWSYAESICGSGHFVSTGRQSCGRSRSWNTSS